MADTLKRKIYKSREEWLAGRVIGLGASEAAAVVGLSKFKTNVDVWSDKVGLTANEDKVAADKVNEEAKQRGKEIEASLRSIFTILNPQYAVEYHEYDILYQVDNPWLTATLDGELTEVETNRKGVLEIKSAYVTNRAAYKDWDKDHLPQQYYIQVLHQLLVTRFDFAVVYAILIFEDGTCKINRYTIERNDVLDDLRWLYKAERKQWQHVVDALADPEHKEDYRPGVILIM